MDRKNKRWETTKVVGQTGLSDVEETSLKYYVDYMASINHPLSVAAVKAFSWVITKKSDRPNRFKLETGPGDKWFRNFKKRQNLSNRKHDKVDRGKSRMANMTVFNQHFDLRNKPSSIFNCDESMARMDRRTGKVVVSRKTNQQSKTSHT